MRFLPGALAALLVLLGGAEASGEPATRDATAEARASPAGDRVAKARFRYALGVTAYRDGKYDDAIKAFLEADTLAPSAAHSFNIARSYERLRDPLRAAAWYRDYLRRTTSDLDHAAVERRVAMLEGSLRTGDTQALEALPAPGGPFDTSSTDERAGSGTEGEGAPQVRQRATVVTTLPAGPDRARRSAPDPMRAPLRLSGIVSVTAGGVAMASAAVFEILRRNTEAAALRDPSPEGSADKSDTARNQKTASQVLAGSGAILLATGGVLLLVGTESPERRRTAVSARCGLGGCVASLSGTF